MSTRFIASSALIAPVATALSVALRWAGRKSRSAFARELSLRRCRGPRRVGWNTSKRRGRRLRGTCGRYIKHWFFSGAQSLRKGTHVGDILRHIQQRRLAIL